MNLALVDEAGARWIFDTNIGHSSKVAEIVGRPAVARVLISRYRDTSEATAEIAISVATREPASAGIYRLRDLEIAVVSIEH